MLFDSRKAAFAAGQNKYHTGRPCKNGHLTYRYVSSGTCSGCIRRAELGYQTPVGDDAFAKFLAETTEVLIFLPPSDVENMREAMRQLNVVRFGDVANVFVTKKPVSGGLAKYSVRAHPADAQTVLAVAHAFCAPFMASGAEAYARIHGARQEAMPAPIVPRA